MTEFIFFIEGDLLYFGQPNQQKIIMAHYKKLFKWRPSEITKFSELEVHLSNLMNSNLDNLNQINSLIKKSLFNLVIK